MQSGIEYIINFLILNTVPLAMQRKTPFFCNVCKRAQAPFLDPVKRAGFHLFIHFVSVIFSVLRNMALTVK